MVQCRQVTQCRQVAQASDIPLRQIGCRNLPKACFTPWNAGVSAVPPQYGVFSHQSISSKQCAAVFISRVLEQSYETDDVGFLLQNSSLLTPNPPSWQQAQDQMAGLYEHAGRLSPGQGSKSVMAHPEIPKKKFDVTKMPQVLNKGYTNWHPELSFLIRDVSTCTITILDF